MNKPPPARVRLDEPTSRSTPRRAPSTPLLLSALALGLVTACGPGSEIDFTSSGATGGTGGTGAGGTGGATSTATAGNAGSGTGATSSGGTGGSAAPTWPKACADVYDQDTLPTFELTFTDAELAGMESDCQSGIQQYRPAQLTYAGETVDAMVRLKGNWSWDCGKMQFVVSFNEVDPQGRFHGLRKLVFDAPWYDQTLLHERVAFPFFKSLGLPYSCVNNARVLVNGEYQGVYANVERLDKEYLERNFEESDGNLYQAGAELKTNEDIGDTSDIQALNAAATVAELETLMDLDQAVSEWAAEAMLPAMDNYWAGVEINYYLYHHPSRGFLYVPYDMDIVFGDGAYPDGSLIWPDAVNSDPILYEHPGWKKEPLMMKVLSDGKWCTRFVQQLGIARAAYSPAEMSAQVDLWNTQISAALSEDTHRPFGMTAHNGSVASMKAFFAARAAFVDNWLAAGNHCPASF